MSNTIGGQSVDDINNIIIGMLQNVQQTQKEQNESLTRLEHRLAVSEIKTKKQEEINQKVEELVTWKNKYLGLHAFFIYAIPLFLTVLSIYLSYRK